MKIYLIEPQVLKNNKEPQVLKNNKEPQVLKIEIKKFLSNNSYNP